MSTAYDNSVRPEFDAQSETYRVSHDTDSPWEVSTTLVLSLSSLTGDEPTQMRPLNRAVDPDKLTSHVRGRDQGALVSFDFHGYHVTARDDGQITFTPLDEQEA